MSIEAAILLEAQQIATHFKQRAAHLEREYAELQTKADEIKAQRDDARTAPDRLLDFKVKLGWNYQCPRCWITRKSKAVLCPIDSDGRMDFLRCDGCGHTISI